MKKLLLNIFIISSLIFSPLLAHSSVVDEIKIASGLELTRVAARTAIGKAGVVGLASYLIMLPIYYLDDKAAPINKVLDERDEAYNSIVWGQLMQDPSVFKSARQTLNQAVDLLNQKCSEKSLSEKSKGLFKKTFECGVHPSRVYLSQTHYVHQSKVNGETYWFVPATLLILKNPVQSIAMALSSLAAYYQVSAWVKEKYDLDPVNGSDGKGKFFSEFALKYGNSILGLPEDSKVSEKEISDALAEKIYDLQYANLQLGSQDQECLTAGSYCYRLIDLKYRAKSATQILSPCGSIGIEKLFIGIPACEKIELDPYLSGLIKTELDKTQSQINKARSIGNAFNNVWTRVIGVGLSIYIANKVPVKKITSSSRIVRFVGGFVRFGAQVFAINEAVTLPVEGVQLLIEGKVEPTQQLLNGLETLVRQNEQNSISKDEFYKRLQDVFTRNGAESTHWILSSGDTK